MISAPDRRKRVELINEAREAGARLGSACKTMGITARTCQRWTRDGDVREDLRPTADRPAPPNKLTPEEERRVLDICHEKAYASLPPSQIVPRLADQGIYVASESSFYRVLHRADEQHHRGRTRKPKSAGLPKGHCATGPNQVWSWDITWLKAPVRGTFFYLYMMMDIFSRKIVGWEVHPVESAELGAMLLQKAVLAEGCMSASIALHADNGSPQKGFTMKAKMEALGVSPSYSRPRVSNDNPYSESLFRTAKYRPEYPEVFETIEAARKWGMTFVRWYNEDHRHSAIRYVTPAQRHRREETNILARRDRVYQDAKARHPERWAQKTRNWEPVGDVWLNRPDLNQARAA